MSAPECRALTVMPGPRPTACWPWCPTSAKDPAGIVARYRDRLGPGSCLVLSQFASESAPEAIAALRAVAAGTPVETYFRSRDEILRLFAGFELLEPGLASVQEWRPDSIVAATRLKITGGVGRKR